MDHRREVVAAFSRDSMEDTHRCIAEVLNQRGNKVIEGEWHLPAVHTFIAVDAEENYSDHQDEALGRLRSCRQEVGVMIRRLALLF